MKRAKAVQTFGITYARAHLGTLIDKLAPGACFIIAVNGKPKAKVVALTDEEIERLVEQKR